MITHSCPLGVLEGVLGGQLFVMPRVIELCLSGSLGSFHWYCRAREEGAVSQEGEKFESVLHTFSGSLASVVLTLSWQPHGLLPLCLQTCFVPGAGSGICHCCDMGGLMSFSSTPCACVRSSHVNIPVLELLTQFLFLILTDDAHRVSQQFFN